jgi:hypothetical protein
MDGINYISHPRNVKAIIYGAALGSPSVVVDSKFLNVDNFMDYLHVATGAGGAGAPAAPTSLWLLLLRRLLLRRTRGRRRARGRAGGRRRSGGRRGPRAGLRRHHITRQAAQHALPSQGQAAGHWQPLPDVKYNLSEKSDFKRLRLSRGRAAGWALAEGT